MIDSDNFDMVLQIRPDVKFIGKIDYFTEIKRIRSHVVYSHFPMTIRKNIECPDQFFLGQYAMMKKISCAYSGIKKYMKEKTKFFPQQFFAHTTLAYYCFLEGIFIEKLPTLDKLVLTEYERPINDNEIYASIKKDLLCRDKNEYDEMLLLCLSI